MIRHHRLARAAGRSNSSHRPDLFDRQQRSEPGSFNAPGCAFQENYYEASKDIPIDSCYCFGTSSQCKFMTSPTFTDSILILTQFFSGYIGCHGNFIGNLYYSNQNLINTLSCSYLQTFCCCISKLANRQRPEVPKQLPMPPSLAKPREKALRVPSHRQSIRKQQRLLLLLQGHRSL
jgi:hypothetical protein